MKVLQISVAQARSMIEAESIQVVDIRDPGSYQAGHINGAINLNQKNLQSFLDSADKRRSLIVCCYHGVMSIDAAQYFLQQGFEKVFSLDGGYSEWQTHRANDVV